MEATPYTALRTPSRVHAGNEISILTDKSLSQTTPLNEPLHVAVTFRNPLLIPLQLSAVHLLCKHSAAKSSEGESFLVEPVDLLLAPEGTEPVDSRGATRHTYCGPYPRGNPHA